jgi:hypothetical protein
MIKISGITLETFCDFHQVKHQQILSFIDFGLVEIKRAEEVIIIPEEQVEHLERCLRLANDLGVNLEGVEIISNMRVKMLRMQHELDRLALLSNESIELFIEEGE